jgi:hypothetical protein
MTEKIPRPESVDEMLRFWLVGARKRVAKNERAASRLERRGVLLGYATAVSSAVAAAALLASLAELVDPSRKHPVELLGLVFGIASTAIAAVNTSSDYASSARKYRAKAGQYKSTVRDLELVAALLAEGHSGIDGQSLEGLIRQAEDKLNDIEANREAPVIPRPIDAQVEKRFSEFEFVTRAEDLKGAAG